MGYILTNVTKYVDISYLPLSMFDKCHLHEFISRLGLETLLGYQEMLLPLASSATPWIFDRVFPKYWACFQIVVAIRIVAVLTFKERQQVFTGLCRTDYC